MAETHWMPKALKQGEYVQLRPHVVYSGIRNIQRADQCILSSHCLFSNSMSASFFTVSSLSGNNKRNKFSCISCSFKTLKNSHMKVAPAPLASMITFFTSSDCKLYFLVPGITHSQETKNHNKQQFPLLVFSDDRLISKETEKQNEVCNQSRNF